MTPTEDIAFRETVMIYIHRHAEKHGKPFNGTLIISAVRELADTLRARGERPGLTDPELNAEIGVIVNRLAKP